MLFLLQFLHQPVDFVVEAVEAVNLQVVADAAAVGGDGLECPYNRHRRAAQIA